MEPVASKSKKHFVLSIIKSIFRIGGCYGLWMTGTQMGEPVLQATAVFFGIAEILGILEEL
jgi:nucleoside recognition membrane protein YjiH